MKYVNAQQILPEKLLQEVQRYVQGETLYVPRTGQDKKRWGTVSGGKQLLEKRNEAIRTSFEKGTRVEQLAADYHLAVTTIRKIVYSSQ
ncbi:MULTISPECIES: CD3324 family protein [unclassified Exiguobacterium]|uniref:CD3324 family protein n=1 Tax=unclassified Exiguobacterium TaxID=2644629 RepID=UPI001BE8DF95|nr:MULTISPECIES: CD3324 family protein [unclassified Exiguobacterium]